jgi:hypothetical protein
MAVYATETQLRRRIPKAPIDADTSTELTEILGAVSRAIDRDLKVADDFFAPAGAASNRVVFGSGKSFLDLPTFLYGTVTIAAPAGEVVPNFTVQGLRLVTLSETGARNNLIVWTAGIPYTINGTWGFTATPEDIREATLQTAVRWWRGKDEAFSGVIGGINKDGNIIERDLPAPVRRMLDNWRRKTKRPYIA